MSYLNLVFIGLGGALGAIARSMSNSLIAKLFVHSPIPIGTLCVNAVGGFLIGFIMSLTLNMHINHNLKSFLVTGFLGGLTTFSTFSYENMLLIQSSNFFNLFLNIVLNIFLSLAFCYFGLFIVKITFS